MTRTATGAHLKLITVLHNGPTKTCTGALQRSRLMWSSGKAHSRRDNHSEHTSGIELLRNSTEESPRHQKRRSKNTAHVAAGEKEPD